MTHFGWVRSVNGLRKRFGRGRICRVIMRCPMKKANQNEQRDLDRQVPLFSSRYQGNPSPAVAERIVMNGNQKWGRSALLKIHNNRCQK